MESHTDDYDKLKNQGTGSQGKTQDYKIIVFPLGKYQIKIILTPTNEFIEVVEVKINKEFLSHKQKIASRGHTDVDEYYPE